MTQGFKVSSRGVRLSKVDDLSLRQEKQVIEELFK